MSELHGRRRGALSARRAGAVVRRFAAVLIVAWPVSALYAGPGATNGDGEAIFRRGHLASGEPVHARSETAVRLAGDDVACANCHRRSGLGAVEGRSTVPPITGRYLYASPTQRGEDSSLPYVEGTRRNRPAYTDATLARAVREGVDSSGRPLSALMPRFDLADREFASLVDYLQTLDRPHPVGITDTELELATIVTPDADPVARAGMLSVLNQFVADTNATHFAAVPSFQPSARTQIAKSMFRAHRKWTLHVWQLEGPADTWQAQLEQHLAAEPVFAVLSGLAGSNWAPVQAFCEKAELPCLFPNVEAPPQTQEREFYTPYFSRGVLLEADLIAGTLKSQARARPGLKVLQIYREADVGEPAARALAAALVGPAVEFASDVLPAQGATQRLHDALQRAAGFDAVVLWLRPADLAVLSGAASPDASIFFSGLMGGLERAPLSPAWRSVAHMAQPVDLPERRVVRVDYAMGWFALRHLPVVAPRVQADTYLACGLLSEALNHSADVADRDFLLEKFEDMIERRVLTGYYPRLSLAPGQRFASKGGYIVRFAKPEGSAVVAEGTWTVQ